MGFWDGVTDVLGSTDFWAAMLPSVLSAGGGILNNNENYTTTQAGQAAQIAATRENLQAQLDAQAALSAAEVEAMKEAAGIKAAADIKGAKIGAGASLYATKEKMLADTLALRLQGARGFPEVIQAAGADVTRANQAKGMAGQAGFSQAADILSRFKA